MSHRHGGFRAGQRGRKSENVCDKDRVNLSVIFIYLTFCLLSPYTYENTQKHIQAPPCLVCRLRIGKAWIRNAWQVLFLNSICSWTFHRELSNAVDRLEKLCHNASINLTQVSSFSFFSLLIFHYQCLKWISRTTKENNVLLKCNRFQQQTSVVWLGQEE